MTKSTSFSQFNPVEVIERINIHLLRLEIIKKEKKDEWFKEMRDEGKSVGFWPFKKKVPWDEEELERYWDKGDEEEWFSFPPRYTVWSSWDNTKSRFERIKKFCQLATDEGNRTVNLTVSDALFAYNWE